MVQVFKAGKGKGDLYEVSQFGWLDIAEAYRTGNVVGSLEGTEAQSNGIDDPRSIMGKPSDVFEAYRMHAYIEKSGASKGVGSENQSVSPSGPIATE